MPPVLLLLLLILLHFGFINVADAINTTCVAWFIATYATGANVIAANTTAFGVY